MTCATAVCQWHTQACGTVFPSFYPSLHGTELVTNSIYGLILSIKANVSNRHTSLYKEQNKIFALVILLLCGFNSGL